LHYRIGEYEDELRQLEDLLGGGVSERGMTGFPYYKLVVFDLDGVIFDKPWQEDVSTEVAISTWDVLFQEIGLYNVHEKLKQNFVSGIFDSYMTWSEAACNVLKSVSLDKKTFQNVIDKRPLSQGAVELFQKLREGSIRTAIVTGSFEELAERANKELGGIDHTLAHCKLVFNKKGVLESCILRKVDYKDKASFVEEIAKQDGVSLEQIAYVGDDVNDLEVFGKVGLAIAFNSRKRKVQQAADVVIDSRDLTKILPHLYVTRGTSRNIRELISQSEKENDSKHASIHDASSVVQMQKKTQNTESNCNRG
jgi:phosphoserine phosphatase